MDSAGICFCSWQENGAQEYDLERPRSAVILIFFLIVAGVEAGTDILRLSASIQGQTPGQAVL